MPTLIISYSETLCNFLAPLLLELSSPQQRHLLNVVHALLVCPFRHKVLTALTRLLRVPHADHFALADFLRASPWDPQPLWQRAQQTVLAVALQVYSRTGGAVFLSVDDTLCVKSVNAEALEAVSFYHDHVRARAQHRHYSNAAKVLLLTLRVGPWCCILDYRLYLRRKQVNTLNYHRARAGWREPKLTYVPLPDLVQAMLRQVQPALRPVRRVYVLADAWFAAKRLFQVITDEWHWQFLMASPGNRKLGRFRLDEWWTHLGHQAIRHVRVATTKGSHTYLTRRIVGRLPRYGHTVVAVISKSGRRRQPFVYLLCSDPALSADTALHYYAHRWDIEVALAFLKGHLGLDDFRVHSVEATQRWLAVVFVAAAFIGVQVARHWLTQPAQPLPSPADVLLDQQREQLHALVAAVARLARAGLSDLAITAHLGLT
jgi:hypothetical protein